MSTPVGDARSIPINTGDRWSANARSAWGRRRSVSDSDGHYMSNSISEGVRLRTLLGLIGRCIFVLAWVGVMIWSCFYISLGSPHQNLPKVFAAIGFALGLQILIYCLISPMLQKAQEPLKRLSKTARRHLYHGRDRDRDHHGHELGRNALSSKLDRSSGRIFKDDQSGKFGLVSEPLGGVARRDSGVSRWTPVDGSPHLSEKQLRSGQTTVSGLPVLIWSSKLHNRNVAEKPWQVQSFGGKRKGYKRAASSKAPRKSTTVQAPSNIVEMLHAISQPDLGRIHGNYRVEKLPQIREAFGELEIERDWQGMLDVEVTEGHVGDRGIMRLWADVMEAAMGIMLSSDYTLGMIIRNVAWCSIFVWSLTRLQRPHPYEDWDTSRLGYEYYFSESVFQFSLTFDFIFFFVIAENKVNFLAHWTSLIDFITLPILQALIEVSTQRKIKAYSVHCGALRLFRLLRLETLMRNVFPWIDPVKIIIFGLLIDTIVILASFACFMFTLEAPLGSFYNLFDFMYYSVVTLTTVGYGDFYPTKRTSRLVTTAAIVGCFITFPYQVQRLLTALHIPPSVIGQLPSRHSDFFLFYGKIRPRQLSTLIHEIAHALPGSLRNLVVITPFPAKSFSIIVRDAALRYKVNLCVSQKSPTSEELQYYCGLAKAVYIFADPKGGISYSRKVAPSLTALLAEDQKTLLNVIKLQPWCWPYVPLSVQLSLGSYANLTSEMGAYHVVSLEALKLRSIARSVSGCPGFITLVFNWYNNPANNNMVSAMFNHIRRRAAKLESSLHAQEQRRPSSNPSADPPQRFGDSIKEVWRRYSMKRDYGSIADGENIISELNFYYYFCGLKYHIYRLEFPECMEGLEWSVLVRVLYKRYQIFLIGLVTLDKKIVINPIGYKVHSQFVPNLIEQCSDLEINASENAAGNASNQTGNGSNQTGNASILSGRDSIQTASQAPDRNVSMKFIAKQTHPAAPPPAQAALPPNAAARRASDDANGKSQDSNAGLFPRPSTPPNISFVAGIVLAQRLEDVSRFSRITRFNVPPDAQKNETLSLSRGGRSEAELKNSARQFLTALRESKQPVEPNKCTKPSSETSQIRDVPAASETVPPAKIRRAMTEFNDTDNNLLITPPETESPRPIQQLPSPGSPSHVESFRLTFEQNPAKLSSEISPGALTRRMPSNIVVEGEEVVNLSGSDISDDDNPTITQVTSAIRAFERLETPRPVVLCCGWPRDLGIFLRALEANRPSFVVFLAPQEAPNFARWNKELRHFTETAVWVEGSPLNLEDLRSAGALLATAVVILASQHSFQSDEDVKAEALISIDSQSILIRQQFFALFARVEDYIKGFVTGPDEPPASSRRGLTLPFMVTELRDRESLEFLSAPRDVFLLAAFREASKAQRLPLHGATLYSDLRDLGADDFDWAEEGGRQISELNPIIPANHDQNILKRSMGVSSYATQSEYRSGGLFLREMSYPLIGYGVQTSRFSMDSTLIDHLIDGSHSFLDAQALGIRDKAAMKNYLIGSPLCIEPCPPRFIGKPFREPFLFFMKVNFHLIIAVRRKISSTQATAHGLPPGPFTDVKQDLVISCPSATMQVLEHDHFFVLKPAPSHVVGLLLSRVVR